MVEKLLFLNQIFELEISMDLHVLGSTEFKNHICIDWSVCMSVYASAISIIQKQVVAETVNLIFKICIICKYYSTCTLYGQCSQYGHP